MSAAKRFHFTQDGKTTSVTARYREMASLSSLFKKLRSYEDVWYQDQRLKDIDDINAFFLYPNGAEFQVKIQESMVRLKVLCQKSPFAPDMEWVHTEDDVYQKTMTVKELAGEVIKERMQKNLVPEKDDSALLGSIGDEVRFVFPPLPAR